MIKLSIITINYNDAEGLRKTLASVAAQTYPHIQHIVVDGGSTDGSDEIIREYADNQAKGERIDVKGADNDGANNENKPTPIYTTLHNATPPKHHVLWVSESDKGIYNAMNKGIEIALGRREVNDDHTSSLIALLPHRPIASSEYIQILNAGDILAAPDVTERMFAAMQQLQKKNLSYITPYENCPAIFYGNMVKEWPNGHRKTDKCGGMEYRPESFLYFYMGTLNHDCAYIRKDLFERYGLYNENMKICSDWEWYIRVIILGEERTYYTNIDVTIFDMTGISESNGINRDIIIKERRAYLESILPKSILGDYDKYSFPILQYQRLKKYRVWGIVHLIERILFKIEKWFTK